MPNRIIKESIRTSKAVNSITDFEFRLWTYLITYVDDYGRGSADAELIKGLVLPRRKGVTEKCIVDALCNLACKGLISLYEHDGESYFCFPNWEKHQQVRSKVSRFPAPDSTCNQMISNDITCNQMISNVPVIQSNTIQSESESEFESNLCVNARKRAHTRFTPPSVDEVREYCRERGNTVDPQKFVDFYDSKGWKVGNTPMKDWKACVRTWEKRDGSTAKPKDHFDLLLESIREGGNDY